MAELDRTWSIATRLVFAANRTVQVRTGKVEYGQGIVTAMAQIVVDELGLQPSQVTMLPTETSSAPNEGMTVGSRSVEVGGSALRGACQAARYLCLSAVAKQHGVDAAAIAVNDGEFVGPDGASLGDYWSIAPAVDFEVDLREVAVPGWLAGSSGGSIAVQRIDLPDKVFGRGRFIQDLELPGMVHARVVRPPLTYPELVSGWSDDLRSAFGDDVTVIKDGTLIAVLAPREERAVAVADQLRARLVWASAVEMLDDQKISHWLRTAEADTVTLAGNDSGVPEVAPVPGVGDAVSGRFGGTFSRGFIAHASIATSCGLAQWSGGELQVWSHTQGPFRLRDELAHAFGIAPHQVAVTHVEGAGCYGHNAADDVAFDAAFLAKFTEGKPVRVLWERQDELGCGPLGSALTGTVSVTIDDDGHLDDWVYDVWGVGFSARPGFAGYPGFLGYSQLADTGAMPAPVDPDEASGLGIGRNARPAYRIAHPSVRTHRMVHTPIRCSSMRALGAHFNVFAIESLMDEIAESLGRDPLEYRLDQLDDPRARQVLQRVAALARWNEPGTALGENEGRGIAYGRYKEVGAYCAAVVEVEATDSVRVKKIYLSVDCGDVVNVDGAKNQLEGGAIQAVSWSTTEAVHFGPTGITSLDWESYPILTFTEIPEVAIDLVENVGNPSKGVGEAVAGPVAGAIGNALAQALGVRIKTMPFTPENVIAGLEESA